MHKFLRAVGFSEYKRKSQIERLLDQAERSVMETRIVQMEDGVAQITVNLLVAYGSRIPSMCAKVQENVKSTVQNMTGITVSRVNVVVRGVVVPQAAE